jgi:ribosomal protein L37AE/L43A
VCPACHQEGPGIRIGNGFWRCEQRVTRTVAGKSQRQWCGYEAGDELASPTAHAAVTVVRAPAQ